ncbi:hypothetical protein GVX82_02275, partial [Patescibacteria group bacterium]|nr:hypothetical protein [Patescibacteria group bacterium]
EKINYLKEALHALTFLVLSDKKTQHWWLRWIDCRTIPEEVFVYQHEIHETDVNAAPVEIHIEAGRPKGRCSDKVQAALGKRISVSDRIPRHLLGHGKSCIFVNFHPHNGFGFIPKP